MLLYVVRQDMVRVFVSEMFFPQLLRGVTISNGGVLPRIHPELLSKKRGGRVKVDSQASVPEKQEERSKSKKPVKSFKKVKGKRGRKPKVSQTGFAGRWGGLMNTDRSHLSNNRTDNSLTSLKQTVSSTLHSLGQVVWR